MSTVQSDGESLLMAMELSNRNWKLAFGNAGRMRRVNVEAGDVAGLREAILRARQKFGLGREVRVLSCYEAGRDGFWIHRMLEGEGVDNQVVDPASIERPRRARTVKTDRLDAEKLLEMLRRWVGGEKRVWRVVRGPTAAEEDQRYLHRELQRLKKERGGHLSRIRSLLVLHGVRVKSVGSKTAERARDWRGCELPEGVRKDLSHELDRLELVREQIGQLEALQKEALKVPGNKAQRMAQKLYGLRSVGPVSSWTLSHEFFAWRDFDNRRQVGASAGLTGTPYASGQSNRDQGISKAGNARVRHLMIELAWSWLRYQPRSELSLWFARRFGHGTSRIRRVGIVALARKLLVALWKYVQKDELPQGAVLKAI